jgi:E3 ubiquitin-protein ligase BIG BROTHER-like protein
MDALNESFIIYDDESECITVSTTPTNKVQDDSGDFSTHPRMGQLDVRFDSEPNEGIGETRDPPYSTPTTSPQISPRDSGEDELEQIDDTERTRRDEEDSYRLAQQLMAEEAIASYSALSLDYLRDNSDQFSAEDLAALQAAMDDDHDHDHDEADLDGDGIDDDGGMSYELMLRLGEQAGDVKTERWSRVAQGKIDALPLSLFDPEAVLGKDVNDCDVKCLICQHQYEKGDRIRRLPCGHCFHAESCVDQWLLSKDFCPYCRDPIVKD